MSAAIPRMSTRRLIAASLGVAAAVAVAVWLIVFGMLRTHPEEFAASPDLPIRAALIAFLVAEPLSLFYFALRRYR